MARFRLNCLNKALLKRGVKPPFLLWIQLGGVLQRAHYQEFCDYVFFFRIRTSAVHAGRPSPLREEAVGWTKTEIHREWWVVAIIWQFWIVVNFGDGVSSQWAGFYFERKGQTTGKTHWFFMHWLIWDLGLFCLCNMSTFRLVERKHPTFGHLWYLFRFDLILICKFLSNW